MRDRVIFRVDANSEIGLGHFFRCLALAQFLRKDFDILFCCSQYFPLMTDLISTQSFAVELINHEDALFDLTRPHDMVILDGYHFDENYQRRLRALNVTVVCIDDLAEGPVAADLIINHSPGVEATTYDALPHTEFALGPDYALLRPAFLNAVGKERNEERNSVLICFGGADPKNLTRQCLAVALGFDVIKHITLILGGGYRFEETLHPYLSDPRVSICRNLDEAQMVWALLNHAWAIVPASGILLEALACGGRIISGMYIDNQLNLYTNYRNANAFVDARDFSEVPLREALNYCLLGQASLNTGLIDGHSGERLRKIFLRLRQSAKIQLRVVTLADRDLTFEWATSPKVRVYAFNKRAITIDDHTAWFSAKVSDQNCYYYIAECEDNDLGSVRFDRNNGEAVISYLVAPDYHGKGWGLSLLREGIKRFVEDSNRVCTTLLGYVMSENEASVRIFRLLGFTESKANTSLRFEKQL